jgi:heme/copper-type cytochrome/quinol oxidase subunit 2
LFRHWGWLAVAAVAVLSAMAVAAGSFIPFPTARPQTREIRLEASRFSYSPERMTVNKGDHVILTFAPQDVTHGIYIDDYGLQAEAAPGKTAVLDFVADKPGTFRVRCSINCGELHPFMIGLLAVQPNSPFIGAAMAVLAVGLAATAWGWRQRGSGDA